MAPNLFEDTQQRLLGAEVAGHVSLVDENGRSVTLLDAVGQRVWAHLRDAADGRVYVHELLSSQELLQPRYLDLLGVNV